jgi:superfamily I DNA and/or RNA helicase
MTVALVSHLVRQGEYGPDDIAVLTPYLGQLLKLRRRMESMFEISLSDRDMEGLETLEEINHNAPPAAQPGNGPNPVAKTTLLKSLRVATVDNFQGEEAKVIVISLVRSNPQNNCGFLNTPNRINVLLSRAKHGMYIIDNANTYSPVPMWSTVINTLQTKGNFGTALELHCPRHPDTSIAVSKPDDFLVYAPESGCSEACDRRLQCGHKCGGRCHSELLHAAFKCLEKCQRFEARLHTCLSAGLRREVSCEVRDQAD